ncbi:hypothetical protein AVEN_212584-1, partial [Araneus ventricosus]
MQNEGATYVNPDRTLRRVDFPAPEGPMMAISSPVFALPETPFRMGLPGRDFEEKCTIWQWRAFD